MASAVEIADLLSRAGGAHHIFEQTELKGVYDTEWPAWYADWCVAHGLNRLLKTQRSSAELARLLNDINEQRKQSSTDLDWAAFTAQELLKRDG